MPGDNHPDALTAMCNYAGLLGNIQAHAPSIPHQYAKTAPIKQTLSHTYSNTSSLSCTYLSP